MLFEKFNISKRQRDLRSILIKPVHIFERFSRDLFEVSAKCGQGLLDRALYPGDLRRQHLHLKISICRARVGDNL